MNSVEFHDRLNLKLAQYLDIPSIELKSVHKQYFLNDALNQVFNEYFDVFEKNTQTRFALGTLIKRVILNYTNTASSTLNHTNGIMYNMPSALHFTVKEYCVYDGTFIKVKPVTYDYYNDNIDNTKRKPYSNLFWRLDMGDDNTATTDIKREIIHDGSVTDETLLYYHLTYIKKPEEVDIKNNDHVDIEDYVAKEVISRATELIYNYYSNNSQQNQ